MSGDPKDEVEKAIDPIAEDLSGTPRPSNVVKKSVPKDLDDESGFTHEEKVRVSVDADTPPLKVPDTGVS